MSGIYGRTVGTQLMLSNIYENAAISNTTVIFTSKTNTALELKILLNENSPQSLQELKQILTSNFKTARLWELDGTCFLYAPETLPRIYPRYIHG